MARDRSDDELLASDGSEAFAAFYRRHVDWVLGMLVRDSVRRGQAEDRARRRLGLERIDLDDAELAEIDAMGADVRLLRLVEGLPGEQRDAVRARVIDELDYEVIAARLDVPQSTVRKRVSRGLGRLRDRMGGR